jgi:ribosomal protein L28
VCGKGPSFGNSRSHSMYVCTRCLKAGKVTKAA